MYVCVRVCVCVGVAMSVCEGMGGCEGIVVCVCVCTCDGWIYCVFVSAGMCVHGVSNIRMVICN